MNIQLFNLSLLFTVLNYRCSMKMIGVVNWIKFYWKQDRKTIIYDYIILGSYIALGYCCTRQATTLFPFSQHITPTICHRSSVPRACNLTFFILIHLVNAQYYSFQFKVIYSWIIKCPLHFIKIGDYHIFIVLALPLSPIFSINIC